MNIFLAIILKVIGHLLLGLFSTFQSTHLILASLQIEKNWSTASNLSMLNSTKIPVKKYSQVLPLAEI